MTINKSLDEVAYDLQWRRLDHFISYNPGARHRRLWIYRFLHQIKFQTLLDVGCGNGELIAQILTEFAHADFYGVDLSPEVISKNRNLLPEVQFASLNIEKEHLDKHFDVVVCSEVVEHLQDRRIAFKNLVQMVRKGGYLLITAPAGKVYATERLWGHTTHPTIEEIKKLAQHNKLTIIHLFNWGWPFYNLLKMSTNLVPGWAVKNFGSGKYSWWAKAVSHVLFFLNFFNLSHSNRGCQLFILLKKE